jgi:hypothetical protein
MGRPATRNRLFGSRVRTFHVLEGGGWYLQFGCGCRKHTDQQGETTLTNVCGNHQVSTRLMVASGKPVRLTRCPTCGHVRHSSTEW